MPAPSATRPLLAILALAALAGCDSSPAPSSNASSATDERVSIKAADGRMAIDLPGFAADIRMPAIRVSPDMLKLDGVTLYPGTTVAGFDIDGDDKTGADTSGTVTIRFAAPSTVDGVHGYYRDMFRGAGYVVTDTGGALAGRKTDGTTVRLTLAPAASGSTGTLRIGRRRS